jgi:hypothetical protein
MATEGILTSTMGDAMDMRQIDRDAHLSVLRFLTNISRAELSDQEASNSLVAFCSVGSTWRVVLGIMEPLLTMKASLSC